MSPVANLAARLCSMKAPLWFTRSTLQLRYQPVNCRVRGAA
jgi:hypothetical protein